MGSSAFKCLVQKSCTQSFNTLLFIYSEWYGYHFPELIKIVSDNSMYCRLAQLIGNRKELSEENLESLEEVVMDSAKAQAILDASRSSMGEYATHSEYVLHNFTNTHPAWVKVNFIHIQS